MIDSYMAVHVQRADMIGITQLGIGLQPLLRKPSGPLLGRVVLAELSQLLSQATNFGNAIQSHQLSQLARRFVLQLLDRLDATQGHVG